VSSLPKPFRVVSLNANKRVQSPRSLALLTAWLARVRPDLLLLQEPWPHGKEPSACIGSLSRVAGDSNVAAFAEAALPVVVVAHQARWLTVEVGGRRFHDVYFPAGAGDAKVRADLLDALAARVAGERGARHLIFGDFNMAPTAADGLFDGKPTTWTIRRERAAFERLLAEGGLVDATRTIESAERFTYKRLRGGKVSQYRCDLALVDRRLIDAGAVTIAMDHTVRSGGAFTDHSAVLVDL
jgi:exonuclease III